MIYVQLTHLACTQRYRTHTSAPLSSLSTSLFTLLAAPDSTALRLAFLPALLRRSLLPSELRSSSTLSSSDIDARLITLFSNPPNVVVVQGAVGREQVRKAWEMDAVGMEGRIFVGFALVQEMQSAKEEGDRVQETSMASESMRTVE